MKLELAIVLTSGRDMWTTAAWDGVPSVRMADGPMGVASGKVDERDVSVLSPAPVGLAATWDPALIAKVGALIGGEAKRQGIDLILGPNLNLQRTPTCGRAFELFGEDPLLAAFLGLAWIEGLQSRHVGAVAKHIVCNDSETARDSYSAEIDDAALREVYLLPFEIAAAGGCAGLLTAYNKLNGTHCAEHPELLTRILRDEWQYHGFTVSDWFGTVSTAPAMNAGLDLEMPGPARFYGAKLAAAVEAEEVASATVERAAERIVDAALRWAGGDPTPEPGGRDEILADAAAASFVLLRNEGDLLPIAPGKISSLAVIGPNAFSPCLQGGTFAKVAVRQDAVAPLTALAEIYGKDVISAAPGCNPSPRLPAMTVTPARQIGDGATRGMTVDYFDSHDFETAPLGSETRNTNSLTWFAGTPTLGAFERAGGVRASGIFLPTQTGVHRFHIGGTSSVRLYVDGQELLANERAPSPADIMGILKSGDSDSVELSLIAGQPIRVVAELRYGAARAQGLWYGIAEPGDAETLLKEAEELARQSDAVLLMLGETSDSGVESKDRDTTKLPQDQYRLAEHVIAANPNVVVIVNVAHAFDPSIAAGARALMIVWYPGESFGPALATVLSGEREPSGRLPLTIAADESDYIAFDSIPDHHGRLIYHEGTDIGHRGFTRRGKQPAYAFGSGLGYGRVLFEDAQGQRLPDGGANIFVQVKNLTARATATVIQVYREDGALAGFVKVELQANAVSVVTVEVAMVGLRQWKSGEWVLPSSPIILRVGSDSVHLPLTCTIGQPVD